MDPPRTCGSGYSVDVDGGGIWYEVETGTKHEDPVGPETEDQSRPGVLRGGPPYIVPQIRRPNRSDITTWGTGSWFPVSRIIPRGGVCR